ncbi:MAG: trypsin-like peptidase domain-containing protein [Planctomycetota bacterium]|nr:trypsin-like peptidase domain-containing protein [Planctomycetota bacterium]MDI6788308.1 trypsin-like peptidase domain-containing protein [Planctomycetota bacterium]
MMNRVIYLAVLVLVGLIIGTFISRYYDTIPTLRATPKLSQEERDATLRELQGYKDKSSQFVKLVKLVRPSVVSISTKKIFRGYIDDFFWGIIPREFESSQIGSGVIVDNKGYIITNNHVVQGVDEIKVTLDDGREFTGKVIGGDSLTDIAVVKIAADDLVTAILGDSDKIEVGEMVLAIGSPFGLGQTVTSGIISAKRNIPTVGRIAADYPDFIQTDAAINPGNSGGPLVSLNGEVIGINSIIITRSGGYQGIGFAIPINRAKYIMQQLIDKGKVSRPFLGVELSAINEALAEKYGFGSVNEFLKELQIDKIDGVFVVGVIPDSPATESKLREGDLILEYNNQKVNTPDELVRLINKSEVGKEVVLKTLRNGKIKTVKVTVGERK